MSVPIHLAEGLESAGAWRSAVAGLPHSAVAGRTPAGAIVVEPGSPGWRDRARAAAAAGARALVIADPVAPAGESGEIGVPILLCRPGARVGLLPPLHTRPVAVQVEVSAPADALGAVLADALAWVHALVPGPVRVAGSARTAVSAVFHLDADGVSVTGTAVTGPIRRLRVLTLGPERTEVEVARGTRIRVTNEHGVHELPPAWESAERAALRRALDALETGAEASELARHHAEVRLAAEVLGGLVEKKHKIA